MRDLQGNIVENIEAFEVKTVDLMIGKEQVLRGVGARDTQGLFFFQNEYICELLKESVRQQIETNRLLTDLVNVKTEEERKAIVAGLGLKPIQPTQDQPNQEKTKESNDNDQSNQKPTISVKVKTADNSGNQKPAQ